MGDQPDIIKQDKNELLTKTPKPLRWLFWCIVGAFSAALFFLGPTEVHAWTKSTIVGCRDRIRPPPQAATWDLDILVNGQSEDLALSPGAILELELTSSESGYAWIYDVERDQAKRLFPDKAAGDISDLQRVQANQTTPLPPRGAGPIQVDAGPGTETIVVVMTHLPDAELAFAILDHAFEGQLVHNADTLLPGHYGLQILTIEVR